MRLVREPGNEARVSAKEVNYMIQLKQPDATEIQCNPMNHH